jgi:hypothetical protein
MGVTEVVALVSLVVAFVGVAVTVLHKQVERKGERPKLELDSGLAGLTRQPGTLMMFFSIANAGKVAVTVTAIYLELPDDRRMILPWLEGESPLPCRLEAGEVRRFWHPFREAKDHLRDEGYSGLVPVTVVAEDGVGNRYTTQRNFRVSHEAQTQRSG